MSLGGELEGKALEKGFIDSLEAPSTGPFLFYCFLVYCRSLYGGQGGVVYMFGICIAYY